MEPRGIAHLPPPLATACIENRIVNSISVIFILYIKILITTFLMRLWICVFLLNMFVMYMYTYIQYIQQYKTLNDRNDIFIFFTNSIFNSVIAVMTLLKYCFIVTCYIIVYSIKRTKVYAIVYTKI